MPPLPPAPKTLECRVHGHIASHNWQNVFHFSYTNTAGAEPVSDLSNVSNIIYSVFHGSGDWFDNTTEYISSDCFIDHVDVFDLSSSTAPYYVGGEVSNHGNASQVSLSQSALLLSFPIQRRYRGGHGRIYLAGVSPDNTTDGRTWETGVLDAATSFWSSLVDGVRTGTYSVLTGLNQAVLQRKEAGVYLDPAVPWTVAYGSQVADSIIRSQRRRVRNTPTNT